jgi:hypothetical protein
LKKAEKEARCFQLRIMWDSFACNHSLKTDLLTNQIKAGGLPIAAVLKPESETATSNPTASERSLSNSARS